MIEKRQGLNAHLPGEKRRVTPETEDARADRLRAESENPGPRLQLPSTLDFLDVVKRSTVAMDSSADRYEPPSDPYFSGGRHLVFSEDDMASDGSDWADPGSASCSEEDSINSDNYDMEIDTFPDSRFHEKVEIIHIPPLNRPRSMSVQELESLIDQHRQSGTVIDFLCGIDTKSNLLYEGSYFSYDKFKDVSLDEVNLDDTPRVAM